MLQSLLTDVLGVDLNLRNVTTNFNNVSPFRVLGLENWMVIVYKILLRFYVNFVFSDLTVGLFFGS